MTVFWIVLIFCGVGYAIAFTRKGSVARDRLGASRIDIHTPADPATVFARLSALSGRVHVDDKDPQTKILVLSTPVTFFTWGFLYPVYLHAEGSGSAIEVATGNGAATAAFPVSACGAVPRCSRIWLPVWTNCRFPPAALAL